MHYPIVTLVPVEEGPNKGKWAVIGSSLDGSEAMYFRHMDPISFRRKKQDGYLYIFDLIGNRKVETGGCSGIFVQKISNNGAEEKVIVLWCYTRAKAMEKHFKTVAELTAQHTHTTGLTQRIELS